MEFVNIAGFGFDNSSSINTDNHQNICQAPCERPIDCIIGSVGTAETNFGIIFTEQNAEFPLNLYQNGNESYVFVNKTKICKFKTHDNIPSYESFLESI